MTGASKNSRTGHHQETSGTKRGRPCDACRRRKSKCVTEDGNSICVLCKFHSQQCTYLEAPQPRKRSANPSSATEVQSPTKRRFFIKPGTGVEEYDTFPGPSLLKRTLGLQNRHHSEYVGLNAIPDVYGGQILEHLEHNNSDAQSSYHDDVRLVHPNHAFRLLLDSQTEGYDQERSDVDEIEATASGHGPDLVQLYFRIVHPSFPVLHKDVFLEKYARSHREFAPPLLAAVYLLASGYWAYDEKLAKSRRIDTASLQALAFSALQNTMRRPKLSTIQAGLLLSQWQKAFMGSPYEQRDRLTVQLVNLSHGLGLHLDCSCWDIPDWEIGLRRRIGWALYMQDKWTALLESRPSLISQDDWDVDGLSEVDFPDNVEDDQEGSSEVERGRLVFQHMASLSVILAEILRTIFSARARRVLDAAPNRLEHLLEWIKPLQIRLKDWFLTLPESLKMDTAASMKLSSVGYLRLSYLAVEVCMHKNLLRALVTTELPDPTLTQVCRSAANERFINATDFIQRLQAQHLHSFWYFASAKCCALIHSFGQILGATAPSEDEQAMYSRKLKEFKWALKVNSEAGASFMKQALILINHSVRLVQQGPENGSSNTSPASVGFQLTGQEMPSPEQQSQWLPHHLAHNGGMHYDAYHGEYASIDQATFPEDPMFGKFSDELQWMHDMK